LPLFDNNKIDATALDIADTDFGTYSIRKPFQKSTLFYRKIERI
jgi:hypothetical protein